MRSRRTFHSDPLESVPSARSDDEPLIESSSPLQRLLVLGCTACVAALIALAVREGAHLTNEPMPHEPQVVASAPAEPAVAPSAEPIPAVRPVVTYAPSVELPTLDVQAEPLFQLPRASRGDAAARWIRIGRRFLRRDRFSKALYAFAHAARVSPRNAEAWYGVALCQFELGRYAASKIALARSLGVNPRHAMTNVLAGFVAQDAADFKAARVHYDRYLDVEPNGPYSDELVSVLEQLPEDE